VRRAPSIRRSLGRDYRPADDILAVVAQGAQNIPAWDGLEEALRLVGAPGGMLGGKTVIDCTNPVDFTTGRLLPESGSAPERVAGLAAGAHVVKALHLFAGASWPYAGRAEASPVVAICGDDAAAVDQAASMIKDLGARVAVLGGLAARQVEEVAGFVMRVVAAGANPRFAVPDVDPAPVRAGATRQRPRHGSQ
jgi:hypothetical protein